ncbi:MAG: IclR family transcriptional regulator [Acidimicrobiales bacterium]|jgi:DNA-binding IclR family transcriptional regulator
MESTISGVGVIDKAMTIISVVERQKRSLAELVTSTGFSRATAHRLASALEAHGLLRKDNDGRYVIGYRAISLAQAVGEMSLAERALPALAALRDSTGESAQLYVVEADTRVCIASLESPHGLRTIVRTGAVLPLGKGSGGRILDGSDPGPGGWLDSVAERETGVASVSAPVIVGGDVVAAVSVSGPIERMSTKPGNLHGVAVMRAATTIAAALT